MSSLPSFCPRCTGIVYEEIILPDNSYHYGKVVCVACGTHLNWLQNPKVTQEFEQRKQVIEAALANNQVTGWEGLFFRTVLNRRVLSPKQQQKFQEICDRHGLLDQAA